jgi:hypothetical protein
MGSEFSGKQIDTLRRVRRLLADRGFLRMQRLPSLRRPLHLAGLEPSTLLAYWSGGTSPFTPTAFPGAYLALFGGADAAAKDLYRFFFLNETMPRRRLWETIGEELSRRLVSEGLAAEDRGYASFLYRLVPYGDTVFLTDRDQGANRTTEQYVYAGGDSVLLARFVSEHLLDRSYDRALDLCAGTAFQGHNVLGRAGSVLAAEYNPRAVEFARATKRINDVGEGFEIVQSDLWENVSGDFDLVVSNPPYYPVPPEKRDQRILDVFGGDRYGMEKPLRIVEGLERHLRPGGAAAVLAASPVIDGSDLLAEELRTPAEKIGLEVRLHAWKRTNIKLDMDYQVREGIDYLIHYVVEAHRTGRGSVSTVPEPRLQWTLETLNQRLSSLLYRTFHGRRASSG